MSKIFLIVDPDYEGCHPAAAFSDRGAAEGVLKESFGDHWEIQEVPYNEIPGPSWTEFTVFKTPSSEFVTRRSYPKTGFQKLKVEVEVSHHSVIGYGKTADEAEKNFQSGLARAKMVIMGTVYKDAPYTTQIWVGFDEVSNVRPRTEDHGSVVLALADTREEIEHGVKEIQAHLKAK